jgi:uncharacterized protein YraI
MNNRKGLIIVIVAIVVFLTMPVPLVVADADQVVAQTLYSVQIHTGPGQTYATVDQVPAGVDLPVQARNADSQWLLIQYQDKRAWIAAWLTTITGDLTAVPVSGEIIGGPVIVSSWDTVIIRNGPGTGYAIAGNIPPNTSLYPLARNADGQWLLVNYQGLQGWIARWVVTINGDVTLLPVANETSDTPDGGEGESPPPENTPPPPNPPDNPEPGDAPPPYTVTLANHNTEVVRSTFYKGLQMGKNPHAFSKIGDCESASAYFLVPIDSGDYDFGQYAYLESVVQHFAGSFSHIGQAATDGHMASVIVDPKWANPNFCEDGETPLACEYRLHQPSIALIMARSNTEDIGPYGTYYENLRTIVEISLDHGVIPVLTTSPFWDWPHPPVEDMNDSIRLVAQTYDVPLWDLWVSTEKLYDHGVDHIFHLTLPTSPYGQTTHFNETTLQAGMTVRNLEALEILHILQTQVIG